MYELIYRFFGNLGFQHIVLWHFDSNELSLVVLGRVSYFATTSGGCALLGAEYVTTASVISNDCSAIGGQMKTPELCDLDWCRAEYFVKGALYFRYTKTPCQIRRDKHPCLQNKSYFRSCIFFSRNRYFYFVPDKLRGPLGI